MVRSTSIPPWPRHSPISSSWRSTPSTTATDARRAPSHACCWYTTGLPWMAWSRWTRTSTSSAVTTSPRSVPRWAPRTPADTTRHRSSRITYARSWVRRSTCSHESKGRPSCCASCATGSPRMCCFRSLPTGSSTRGSMARSVRVTTARSRGAPDQVRRAIAHALRAGYLTVSGETSSRRYTAGPKLQAVQPVAVTSRIADGGTR